MINNEHPIDDLDRISKDMEPQLQAEAEQQFKVGSVKCPICGGAVDILGDYTGGLEIDKRDCDHDLHFMIHVP